jgi:hypothetical protein
LSQINAIISRPQTCRLDGDLKNSACRTALAVSPLISILQQTLTSYPKIPDLPVIEFIVHRSPVEADWHHNIVPSSNGRDFGATIAEIRQIKSVVQSLPEANINNEVWQTLARLFGSLGSRFADIGWFVVALRMS